MSIADTETTERDVEQHNRESRSQSRARGSTGPPLVRLRDKERFRGAASSEGSWRGILNPSKGD
jgi:hypothetical protein